MYDLNVKDMSCGHCVGVVTDTIKSLDPAAKVEVNLADKRVRVATHCSLQALGDALADAGYPISEK